MRFVSQSGDWALTDAPTKQYQSVVVSSPGLATGETYLVYTGGSVTGAMVDGLLSDGSYNPGSQVDQFSIAETVTYAGLAQGGFMGGPGGQPRRHP